MVGDGVAEGRAIFVDIAVAWTASILVSSAEAVGGDGWENGSLVGVIGVAWQAEAAQASSISKQRRLFRGNSPLPNARDCFAKERLAVTLREVSSEQLFLDQPR